MRYGTPRRPSPGYPFRGALAGVAVIRPNGALVSAGTVSARTVSARTVSAGTVSAGTVSARSVSARSVDARTIGARTIAGRVGVKAVGLGPHDDVAIAGDEAVHDPHPVRLAVHPRYSPAHLLFHRRG
ncbi:MAG TPA: hypothetical protein VF657_08935 [Actinoplanes sp.]